VTGRRIFGVPDPAGSGPVHAVAFSPDGAVIASGDKAGSVFLFGSATGRRLAWLKAGPSTIDSVAFSPDGRELAGAAYDGTVSLWSIAAGKVIATTTVPGVAGIEPDQASQLISVSFLPGGRNLAIGDARSGLYRWTAGADKLARPVTWTCDGGFSCKNSLALSPDGKSVAVTGQGAAGRDAYVWDLASGSLVAHISDPAGYKVTSAALGADGSNLTRLRPGLESDA
jgi:WD40 repeat protein